MGRKPSRSRQHLYICLTLLILFGGGCAVSKREVPKASVPPPEVVVEPLPVPEPPPPVAEPKEVLDRREAHECLTLAQSLMVKGDYEGSLRVSQKAVDLLKDQPPADTAIFTMGLLYAHPKNPKKDNKRAIFFFNRVAKGYPDGPWAEQAKIWVAVLDGVEKLKQVDLEIEERKRDRSR